jgi:hypothetical protein
MVRLSFSVRSEIKRDRSEVVSSQRIFKEKLLFRKNFRSEVFRLAVQQILVAVQCILLAVQVHSLTGSPFSARCPQCPAVPSLCIDVFARQLASPARLTTSPARLTASPARLTTSPARLTTSPARLRASSARCTSTSLLLAVESHHRTRFLSSLSCSLLTVQPFLLNVLPHLLTVQCPVYPTLYLFCSFRWCKFFS